MFMSITTKIRTICIYNCLCLFYREVSTQESLEETALAAANVSKDVTAEDAALGLLLLQVDLLISGHCREQNPHTGVKGSVQTVAVLNTCLQPFSSNSQISVLY